MRTIIAFGLSFLLFVGATAALAEPPDTSPSAEKEWVTIAQDGGESADSEEQAAVSDTKEAELLEPVIVTATRIETPVNRLGSSVTVITREELEQLGSPTITEALSQVPGLDVITTGGLGGTTSVFTRGGRSDFTLIMIDGVPLTDQAGTVDIGHITIDNIEQIEVVRGPQSALYGAEALSGVINIITRKGEGRPTVTFDLEGGNIGNNYESAGLSGSTRNGFNYSVAASHLGTENVNHLDNDDYDNYTVSSRVGYDFNEDATLTAIVRAQHSKLGLPGPTEFLPEDPDDEAKNTQVVFTTLFDQRLTDWWSHVVQASYFYQNYKNKDPESQDPLFINDMVSDYDAKIDRVDVDYHQNFFVFDNQIFTIGTDWKEEQADIDSTSDFGFGPTTDTIDKQRHNLAFYAQASLSFWDRLNLLAGVRYDDNSVYGSETSPRFAASYLIKETGTRLKGSYGEGIKNPSFIDLYYPMFGNPDLEAEKSKAWDAGFEQALWGDRMTFGVTYFHSDFDDLIAFAFPAPQNIETAKSEGVEVELRALLPYHLAFRGAYTYTETEDGEGHRLIRVPRHLVSLNLNYTYNRLMLNFDGLIVSERPDSAFVDLDGDFLNDITDDEANSYVRLDIAGEYRLTENLWLVGKVNNLLDDEQYEEALGFENPGINFLAGVRGVF